MLRVVDVAGIAPDDSGWTGCLLHGFGASSQDLVPLAADLDPGRITRWLFPQAPTPIRVAGMSYGSAWFPRTDGELEQALFGGYFQRLQGIEPAGLAEAAAEIESMLHERKVDPRHLVLGGFSQGAMVAAEVLRRAITSGSEPPAAVLLFSGALIARRWWDETPVADSAAPRRSPLVWWSHGRSDAVLPWEEGCALADAVGRLGIAVTRHEFAGGHEIPASGVESARGFIAGAIG